MKKKGQVWIETVLYTLIGLALIGLVLAFALPKINEAKDKSVVEQAIVSLNDLDDKINAVSSVAGNRRFVEFTLKRGELKFVPESNEIVLTIDGLVKPYSEPDEVVESGRIDILSTEGQKESSVSLTISYISLDLTFEGDNEKERKFTPASVPYRFSIENKGGEIDITEG